MMSAKIRYCQNTGLALFYKFVDIFYCDQLININISYNTLAPTVAARNYHVISDTDN